MFLDLIFIGIQLLDAVIKHCTKCRSIDSTQQCRLSSWCAKRRPHHYAFILRKSFKSFEIGVRRNRKLLVSYRCQNTSESAPIIRGLQWRRGGVGGPAPQARKKNLYATISYMFTLYTFGNKITPENQQHHCCRRPSVSYRDNQILFVGRSVWTPLRELAMLSKSAGKGTSLLHIYSLNAFCVSFSGQPES